MRDLLLLIGIAFIVFAIIAWFFTKTYSPAYIGLIIMGVAGVGLASRMTRD